MKNIRNLFRLVVVSTMMLALFASASPAYASGTTITVNTTDHTITVNGNCSLPEAIQAANTNLPVDKCPAGSGTDTIAFNISGTGLHTIALASPLYITTPITIDGTTQPGYSGAPLIYLNGGGLSNTSVQIGSSASGTTIKGLQISGPNFVGDIVINAVNNVTLIRDYFNTDGTQVLNTSTGVDLNILSSSNDTIGDSTAADRNLFGGGAGLVSSGASSNLIQNNYFGLQSNGTSELTGQPANDSAIELGFTDGSTTTSNTVRGNVIAGFITGIQLDAQVSHTTIAGNVIGVGANGTTAIGVYYGIALYGSSSNTIGGTLAANRNVIAEYYDYGIQINNSGTYHSDSNLIEGNYLGPDGTGLTAPYKAIDAGIDVGDGNNNQIGGTASGAGNLISGNTNGILVVGSGTSGTTIIGNRIGVNVTGTGSLPNDYGISLQSGASAQIAKNYIANNTEYSVAIDSTSTAASGSANNCFTNNGASDGLTNLNSGVTAPFSSNWWGAADGPSGAGTGSGDYVSAYVDFSSWLTTAPAACSPVVSLSGTTLGFGKQIVGYSSALKSVTLTNTGGKQMNITSITTAAPYALDVSSTCPLAGGTLNPGASCLLKVKFSPTVTGAVSKSVTITTNAATSPNQVTLTGSGVSGTQLLINPDFEIDANHDKKPDNWVFVNFNAGTDGRDCTIRNTGLCSLKFVGNGLQKTASETILKSGVAGDDFAYNLWSKSTSVPVTGIYRLQVLLYNGTTLISTQTLNFNSGTHVFQKVSGSFQTTGVYTKVIFTITFKETSGTAWFDTASLYWAP